MQKKKNNNNQYNQDVSIKNIPEKRTIIELGYLLNSKITSSILSASIINLIRKKALLLRYNPKKEDYVFLYNSNREDPLTISETFLLEWLLTKIGNGEKVSLSRIRKDALTNSAYFLSCYRDWSILAFFEGTKPKFFETRNYLFDDMVGYIILSIILSLLSLTINPWSFLVILSLISTLILIIYCNGFYLRTSDGNAEHLRWIAFSKSIKKGDACNNIDDLSLIEQTLVYNILLNKDSSEMLSNLLKKNEQVINQSDFILYVKNGIIDDVYSKIKKLIPFALIISFFIPINRGSKAVVKHKKKEEV
jgi:hypothetical protein